MKSFIVCCGTAAALLAPAAVLPAAAQEPWSLERCIDNAVAHNITIEQYRLRTENQAIQLQNAKYSRLPDLNASAGENFSFGRGLTADNTYTNTRQLTAVQQTAKGLSGFIGSFLFLSIFQRSFQKDT